MQNEDFDCLIDIFICLQAVLAIEYNRKPEVEEASTPPPPPQVSTSEKEPEPEPAKEVAPRVEQIDLLVIFHVTRATRYYLI